MPAGRIGEGHNARPDWSDRFGPLLCGVKGENKNRSPDFFLGSESCPVQPRLARLDSVYVQFRPVR